MKKNFNDTSTDKQRLGVTGAMLHLQKQMNVLAPHPDFADKKGPVFAKKDSRIPANDQDGGLFACLLIHGLTGGLGHAFTAASMNAPSWLPADAHAFSNLDAIQIADEIWLDRRDEQGDDNKKSTVRLGERGTMTGSFNDAIFNRRTIMADPAADIRRIREAAWFQDLPTRQALEGAYSLLSRKLDILDRFQPQYDRHQRAFAL